MANIASRVPWIPPSTPATNDIMAGAPVSGPGQWQSMALSAAWLIGRGGTLVCQGPTSTLLNTASPYRTFYYAIHGREQIKARIWFIGLALSGLSSGHTAEGTVQIPNGGADRPWSLAPITDPATGVSTDLPHGQTQTFRFIEVIASPTNTVETMLIGVYLTEASSSTGINVMVTSIYCRDVPMQDVYLYAGAAQYAPDGDNGYKSGAVIRYQGSSTTGVEALANTQISSTAGSGVRNEARRAALFNWSDVDYPFTTTSASYVPIFQQAPPVLGRFLHYSSGTTRETTRVVRIYVLALCTGGTPTGTVRVTESTGSTTATVSVNSASAAWYTMDLSVDCDDMSRIDVYGGTRSGGRCELTFEAKKDLGTDISVIAISVGEHRQL